MHTHIVFSTKNSQPVLDAPLRPHLYNYMAGILRKLECNSITIGGIEDHVHIGCAITKKHAPMNVVATLKKESSKWLKTQASHLKYFHWQDGYGLFSVSPTHIPQLNRYIENQFEHHKREDFKEELLRLLSINGIVFNEKYLWD